MNSSNLSLCGYSKFSRDLYMSSNSLHGISSSFDFSEILPIFSLNTILISRNTCLSKSLFGISYLGIPASNASSSLRFPLTKLIICSLGSLISMRRLSSPDSIIAVRSSLQSFSRWPIKVINVNSSFGTGRDGFSYLAGDWSAGFSSCRIGVSCRFDAC